MGFALSVWRTGRDAANRRGAALHPEPRARGEALRVRSCPLRCGAEGRITVYTLTEGTYLCERNTSIC
ncbi:hypothetical protein PGIGA_G00230910 [Pangasianodon gigas]|uniref:Uncharacterized protein n=1 Tax=Pangasianodon gigas TaxID=30993 RepID=A0ACC5WLX6_PANGG|nr:hypothetical protein [Pangasianodon gigas]